MKRTFCTLKLPVLTIVAFLFVLLGASLTTAQEWVQPDGRLNQVTHFGGDAFYCVDSNFLPTHQYSDFGQGGFRLLNSEGQELFFIPAEQISAAVAEAKATGKGVLVGEGMGTYGPVQVFTYVTGENDDYFIFTGYDEHGKLNSIEFKFCIPVGPIPEEPGDGSSDEEDCIPFTILIPLKAVGSISQEPCCEPIFYAEKLLTSKEISQLPQDCEFLF